MINLRLAFRTLSDALWLRFGRDLVQFRVRLCLVGLQVCLFVAVLVCSLAGCLVDPFAGLLSCWLLGCPVPGTVAEMARRATGSGAPEGVQL